MTQDSPALKSLQTRSLIVCVVGVALCALLSWHDPDRLWRAYVFAYVACWLIVVGATGLLALGGATGGGWAAAGRPYYLAMAHAMPLVAILFLPIALSLGQIYPWAAHATADHATLSPAKAAYLAPRFFLGRAFGYFAVWLTVVAVLSWCARRAAGGDTPALRRAGAISLVLLAPTVTFAAFDWGMSLEPQWYSSIYGAVLMVGGVLAAHALAICGFAMTRGGSSDSELSHDLGKLLLAFLMVFTYFAFSQFLIIWSGNLPTEITWYSRRLAGGWQSVAVAIVVFQFAVPFGMLLSRDLKRDPRRLAGVAALLLLLYVVHIYWTIVPAFAETGFVWHATNAAALAALSGGLWAAFCWHARRQVAASTINSSDFISTSPR
jgi:hypothetical protein